MSFTSDKSQKVIDELRSAILSGKYASGRFLSIAAIMSRFGIALPASVALATATANYKEVWRGVMKGDRGIFFDGADRWSGQSDTSPCNGRWRSRLVKNL